MVCVRGVMRVVCVCVGSDEGGVYAHVRTNLD